jgi:predicted ATPase
MTSIQKIQIEGYKCFANKTFDFKPLTIFAGINSVGKSSVIQSLLLTRAITEKVNIRKKIYKTQRHIKDPVNVLLNNLYSLYLGNYREILASKAEKNAIKISFITDPITQNLFSIEFKPENQTSLNLSTNEIKNFNELLYSPFGKQCFYYLNAERVGPRDVYKREFQEYPHSGWQGEFALQVYSDENVQIMEILKQKNFEDLNDLTFRNQVNKWMNYIIPGIDIQAKVYHNINQIEANINGSNTYNVGFGISYVLPIIINGLLAKEGTMCIVENPEAHLHPLGQSRIGYFLSKIASAGVQVIVETHSEHVINGIRLAYMKDVIGKEDVIIHFLEKDENQEIKDTIIEILETGDLTKFPKGFLDQTQKDLAEITKFKVKKLQMK